LERLALAPIERYSLDLENRLISSSEDAVSYSIVDDAALGWFRTRGGSEKRPVTMGGWAANMREQRPVEKIIIFLDGASYMTLTPRLPRPNEAKSYAAPGILNSGFKTTISRSVTGAEHEVRAFGIFDGKATELYSADSEANPWLFKKVRPEVPARLNWKPKFRTGGGTNRGNGCQNREPVFVRFRSVGKERIPGLSGCSRSTCLPCS